MRITLTAADGHTLSAWRAGPAEATKALVVVQEIFGVNRHMRRISDHLAAQGYATITPALFDRVERDIELDYQPADVARGRELRGKVPEAGTLADIAAAAAALPAGARRGIIGYCWGGTVAWWGATVMQGFSVAVGYYGGGIVTTKDAVVCCPTQLHFGEQDAGIPLSDVEAIRAAQPGVEVFIYPGAGHGFACEDRGSFNQGAADAAEARALAFLARQLG